MITKLYLREQEHTRRIYDKNIPEEFPARIYKKLREKNKKRNEKFQHNDSIKEKLTTNLKQKQISIEE